MNEDIYVRVAYAALLLVFLFCGVLRRCNLWRFSGKDVAELYPARNEAAAAYFSVLLLLPCVVHPLDTSDTWLYARSFWILYIPVAASLAFRKFFFNEVADRRRNLRLVMVGGLPALLLSVLFGYACVGSDEPSFHNSVLYGIGTLGMFLAAYMLHVVLQVYHKAIQDRQAECRDNDSFPKRFALVIFWIPPAMLAIAWGVFVTNGPLWHLCIAGSITVAGMGILVTILHPQWEKSRLTLAASPKTSVVQTARQPEAVPDRPSRKGDRKCSLSEAQLDSMERQIRKIVESGKLYLDPNLKQGNLEKMLNINRSYLSEVFARRFGSLSVYLNTLRMEHTVRYAAEHPDAKLVEIVQHSGFGSMNTYYRAKTAYEAENLS